MPAADQQWEEDEGSFLGKMGNGDWEKREINFATRAVIRCRSRGEEARRKSEKVLEQELLAENSLCV